MNGISDDNVWEVAGGINLKCKREVCVEYRVAVNTYTVVSTIGTRPLPLSIVFLQAVFLK